MYAKARWGREKLISPARPSRAERGSGELLIVELFCTAPNTGWSRNAITRCGFHNNVVLRNKCQLCSSCKLLSILASGPGRFFGKKRSGAICSRMREKLRK